MGRGRVSVPLARVPHSPGIMLSWPAFIFPLCATASGSVMAVKAVIHLQVGQDLVPWYHLPRLEVLSSSCRMQLLVQANILSAYLSDAERRAPDRTIARLQDTLNRWPVLRIADEFKGRIEQIQSTIHNDHPTARKDYEKTSIQVLWLTSRLLSEEHALALGCAFKSRERLRFSAYMHLLYLLSCSRFRDNSFSSSTWSSLSIHPRFADTPKRGTVCLKGQP